jgi:hypothetical protein
MRKVGNIVSNKLYNPDNKKPPVPVDADEVDSAMERFIRQKYVARALSSSKRRPGSGGSDDNPPPLPPKTGGFFGLRSASSIFPLGSKKKESGHEPKSPRDLPPDPPLRNKSSGVFGASIESDQTQPDEKTRKLAKLRDMGFLDEKRNETVLKGVNWNLERAIETLIRLGEGTQRSSSLSGVARSQTMPVTRSLTPSTNNESSKRPISPASTNPFDMLDMPQPPQPLSSQSTGTLQNKNPYASTNPFGPPQQATPAALELAFQNMTLAPASQPLFPHHTGGLAQQPTSSVFQNPLTGPLTAPLPQATQGFGTQGYSGMPATGPIYAQPTGQSVASYNPFFPAQTQTQQVQQQPQPQTPLSVNTAAFGGAVNTNPFTRSPTRMQQSPTLTQIPEQTQQQTFYTQPLQPALTGPATTNPFFNQMATAQAQAQQMFPGQQAAAIQMPQPTGLMPQMTGYPLQQQQPQRPDKNAILALYNYPPPPKPQLHNQDGTGQQGQTQGSLFPPPQGQQQPQQQQQQQQQQPQLHQPTPISPGSKNPFASTSGSGPSAGSGGAGAAASGGAPTVADVAARHNVSRDSVMALGLDWTNGRHSPDAFAGLSARNAR